MKRSLSVLLLLTSSLCITQSIVSEKQPVLARKLTSDDRTSVEVTITGSHGERISKATFKKDKRMKFDWEKGDNTITVVYKDKDNAEKISLTVSKDEAPKGSEIGITREKITLELPLPVLEETIAVDLVVPNDGKTYEIISGTEAMNERTQKNSPYRVSYKKVIFPDTVIEGDRKPFKIFKNKITKIQVRSSGGVGKDCTNYHFITHPSDIKAVGSKPILRIDTFCQPMLESEQ